MKKVILLSVFLIQLSMSFSQKIDSCKIYTYPFDAMFNVRVLKETIIFDGKEILLNGSCKDQLYMDIKNYLKNGKIYEKNNENKNQIGKLDYRLIIEFFVKNKKEFSGCGSNGLMIYNNTLYTITKKQIAFFLNDYKIIKNELRL